MKRQHNYLEKMTIWRFNQGKQSYSTTRTVFLKHRVANQKWVAV